MHQLVQMVHGFVPPPMIVPPQSNSDHVDEKESDVTS